MEFAAGEAFVFKEPKTYALFEGEFAHMEILLLAPGPKFQELVERLRQNASKF